MKIQILSDLHQEHLVARGRSEMEGISYMNDADLLILAGDIHSGLRGIESFARVYSERPMIYVPGNHEYYGNNYDRLYAEFEDFNAKSELPLRVLVGGAHWDYAGYRFVGATLWTNFELFGPTKILHCMNLAQMSMNDFRLVSNFNAARSRDVFAKELAAIEQAIEQSPLPVVVVTHHLPSEQCVSAQYVGSMLNAAFASEIPSHLWSKVKLWVHGHTHSCVDFERDGCRVVCNPRGYPVSQKTFENPGFNPNLLVTL